MSAVGVLGLAWGLACALPVLHRAATATVRSRAGGLSAGARLLGGRRRRLPAGWVRDGAAAARSRGPVARVVADLGRRLRGRHGHRAVERGVPLALDVLTMAARAGHTPRLAIGAAARWSPGEVATVLARVEQRCALGASLTDSLEELGREEPALRTLADALVVAERSGAPIADLLARVADDARAALRRRAEAHARRVPVRLLFPLVFLVLPAFGLLSVVPALAAGLRHT